MDKGTLFIDIDDTIVKHGTGEPFPGIVEKINTLYDRGWLIVLTTYRGSKFPNPPYDMGTLYKMLQELRIKYHHLIMDSPSPRVVINDDIAKAIQCHGKDLLDHPDFETLMES